MDKYVLQYQQEQRENKIMRSSLEKAQNEFFEIKEEVEEEDVETPTKDHMGASLFPDSLNNSKDQEIILAESIDLREHHQSKDPDDRSRRSSEERKSDDKLVDRMPWPITTITPIKPPPKSPSSFNVDMQDSYHAKIPDQSPRTSPEGSIVPCTSLQ